MNESTGCFFERIWFPPSIYLYHCWRDQFLSTSTRRNQLLEASQRNILYIHSNQEISKCYSFAIIGAPVVRGWSTYSSGEAYGWCNCRQVLDMSILVKLHEMSILLHKFGCCACHVARQVVDVLTRQKANSLTVICFPIAIDVRKYHITEEYE